MDTDGVQLTDIDLDFLVSAVAPEAKDKANLKNLIARDQDFRESFIADDKAFQGVMANEETFLKISPKLYFNILLRKAHKELETASHTIERAGTRKIAVFDAKKVADLLSRQKVLVYLAEMLSSFTKIESYSITYRTRKNIWRKIRFSDLDIDSLIRFCESVEEEHRLGFFKRIADICLLILGVFPEYARFEYRYPFSGEVRPQIAGRVRRSYSDYAEEGKRFYKLAAVHPVARNFGLSEVFSLLHDDFHTALKPLNFIADHYLHYKRHSLFGLATEK